jgi:hypothetical protein
MKKIILFLIVLSLVVGFLAHPDMTTAGSAITTYVVPAVTDAKILPSTSVSSDYASSRISITGCRGEYEPASFVVRANESVTSLSVTASNLSGAVSSIPSSNVDIRVVKCWYVAGTIMPYTGTKTLVPELLLKDDGLVKVQNGENYLKLTSGEYVWISDTTKVSRQDPTIASFPVRDSATLLPVNIASGTNKQFWVTVHIPDDAAAGGYSGKISLATSSGVIGQIDVAVEVLPFKLLAPYLTYSVDYLGVLKDQGTISLYAKNEEQYKAEIADIAAHGGGSPILVQPVYLDETDSTNKFVKTLTIRANAGLSNRNLYYGVPIGYLGYNPSNPTSTTALAALKKKVQGMVDFTKSYGVTQLYIMGVDEAQGTKLSNQRPAWETVESTGAKIWATGHRAGAGAKDGEDNYSLVGDILDVFVCARAPVAGEAALWHAEGNKIWCYANPMSGGEVPETYRRNYGLLLWQKNYDGALAHYQWKSGLIWNDFDDPGNWKAHVFAYPTMNGSVDTTEWEGWREAIDDVRYLTTLRDAISKAKAVGKSTTEVETWLASLKSSDLTTKDLATVRSEMIAHILSLDTTAPAISGTGDLAASSVSSTVTITWTTDERATSQVEHGTTTSYGSNTTLNTSLVTRHSVTLTDLAAGTTYHYRVKSKDIANNEAQSGDLTFTTASASTGWHEQFATSNAGTYLYGQDWRYQTFTPATSHDLNAVSLCLHKQGAPDYTVSIGIYNVDTDHKPTGSPLSTTTFGTTSLTTTASWCTYTFSSGCEVSTGVEYAVVLSSDGGDSSNRLIIRVNTTGGYNGGARGYSVNGGTTWVLSSSQDMAFKEGQSCEGESPSADPTWYEQFTTSNAGTYVYSKDWRYQTFAPSTSHSLNAVSLYLYKQGAPAYTVTVGIYSVDANHKPTGSALCTTTFAASSVTTIAGWSTYAFSSGCQVSAGVEYAIVLSGDGGDTTNRLILGVNTTGGYEGGARGYSVNGGTTWLLTSAQDMAFKEGQA